MVSLIFAISLFSNFYMIVATIFLPYSASVAGKYIPVDPGDVFESPNASLTDWIPNSYPSCWDESITVTKVGNNKKHMEGKARCSILGRHTYGDNRRFF